MSRLVKIVNNKYVQIEEYKNPNICFNTNEYDNFEDYCTLRETFDPFEIFYENQELKERIEYLERSNNRREDTILEQRKEISDLEDNWNKLKEFLKQENYKNEDFWCINLVEVLEKMHELEGSDSDE